MFVFVDESGDPGLDLERGASKFFVVTAVIFEDEQQVQKCSKRIDELRKEAGLPGHVEFKFVKTSDKNRVRFLSAMNAFEFFYLSLVINKANLGEGILDSKESFYRYAVGMTFEFLRPRLQGAIVEIDRTGGLDYGKRLCRFLAKKMKDDDGKPLLKQVKTCHSQKSNPLQLADMVCGAVARSFRLDLGDQERFRKIIRLRELSVHERP
jgi:hypothetical protein